LDRALRISWYDLANGNRDAYLTWLHGTYMPLMVKRPGVVWAAHFECEKGPPPDRLKHTDDKSVPTGNGYILLYGAKDAHAFSDPAPGEPRPEPSAEETRMLAMRVGERVNIFTDEAQADGPGAKRRDPKAGLSPCIQLGSFNCPGPDENEMLAWYARWRLPSMSKLPGCIGVRKIVSVAGWAKHGVLYEFVSLEERNKHFPNHEKSNPAMEAWTDRLVRKLIHAPGSPNVARRIASVVKQAG